MGELPVWLAGWGLVPLAALLAVSCGEEESAEPSSPDVDETPVTLAEELDQIVERYPVVMHGVSMSIASKRSSSPPVTPTPPWPGRARARGR